MSQILNIYTHEQLIDGSLLCQVVLTSCYFISSLFTLSNPYAGFNGFFLGLIYYIFIVLSYYGIRKHITRTHYGFVLAGTIFLIFISLENAIFWGQYSNCQVYDARRRLNNIISEKHRLTSYSVACHHTAAMKSVCTFSVFLFLSYIFQVLVYLKFKDELLGSGKLDEGYTQVHSYDYAVPEPLLSNQQEPAQAIRYPASADL